MTDNRRNANPTRKDQAGPREALEEMREVIRPTDVDPRMQDANRDRTRGDRDRTGDHHDENNTVEE